LIIEIRDNSNKLIDKISRIIPNTQKSIRLGFYELGSELVRSTKRDILRKGRRGNVYKVRGRRHVASIPGEAPASISGDLWRSLNFTVKGSSKMEFGYDNSVDYGKYLELGTSRMRARPGLKINIRRNQKTARNAFESSLRRHLNDS